MQKSESFIVLRKNMRAGALDICVLGANIDLLEYNFLRPLSLALYVRISIATCGKYHAALRHIGCAVGANIDLLIVPSSTADATAVPLPHKACR